MTTMLTIIIVKLLGNGQLVDLTEQEKESVAEYLEVNVSTVKKGKTKALTKQKRKSTTQNRFQTKP